MADANIIVTVDTTSSDWVYSNGQSTTVDGVAETFAMRLVDLGSDGQMKGGGVTSDDNTMTMADGSVITMSRDSNFVHLGDFADGTAKVNPGSFWVSRDGGSWEEVKVTTATIADADTVGDNNITTMTFEYPGKPYQWTWTNIKTA